MSFMKKSFLLRRRTDHWLLGAGAATMPVRLGLGPVLLFIFSCIGIYLACIRHRSARLFATKFYLFTLLYAAWSLGLILYRGEPFNDNRQIGYTLLFAVFAFAAPGMVLMRDPLRAYVLGSRLGVVLAIVSAVAEVFIHGGRIGMGGNAAVFAFVVGVTSISASVPLSRASHYLPNGPQWLILGSAAVMTSETRAVMVVLPIFAAIEVVLFLRRYSFRRQLIAYCALALALTPLIAVGPLGDVISKRFAGMVEYYNSGNSAQWDDKVSADIRLAMWDSAGKIIAQHPLIGVGSFQKMDEVRQQAGDMSELLAGFRHVHNTILDELLNDGIIGLFLLMSALLSILLFLWKTADTSGLRRVIAYFTVISISYGMLHNPLLHEVTISAVMFFFAALNAGACRRMMASRRGVVAAGTL